VWRSRRRQASLDDVVEYLNGIAKTLMRIDARIEDTYRLLGGDDGEEETDS
jgi:hypothetical protein